MAPDTAAASIPDVVMVAVAVNARRPHFTEAYEGFNNCPADYDPTATCDCGKAEAEAALRSLGQCPHNQWSGYPQGRCTECSRPHEEVDDEIGMPGWAAKEGVKLRDGS